MPEHLSKETLNLIFTRQLRGAEFAKAIKHIESCEKCRNNYPQRSAQEVLQAIFKTEPDFVESNSSERKKGSWKLIPAFSFALLFLLLGGAIWLIITQFSKTDVVKTDNSQFNQTTLNINTSSANNISNQPIVTPDNKEQISASNSQNLIANKEVSNSLLTIKTPKEVEQNNNQESFSSSTKAVNLSDEEGKLRRFLTKIPVALATLRSNLPNTRSGQSSGNEPKIEKLSPFSEVVRETAVKFSWNNIKDAERYEITIFDKTYNEIAKEVISVNYYQLKEPLKRGQTYFWKLRASNSQGEFSNLQSSKNLGNFQVADSRIIQQLENLEKTNGNNLKVLNFLIEKGMLTEAKKKLEELSVEEPNNSLFKKLDKRIQTLLNN